MARDEYGLSGAVQHGASTLPDSAFHNFPKRGDRGDPPRDELPEHALRPHCRRRCATRSTRGCATNAKDERKPTDSDEQFFYKTRKKALGPFKTELWDLPARRKATLAKAYDEKFAFLFEQLAIGNTASMVARYITPPPMHRPAPDRRDGCGGGGA